MVARVVAKVFFKSSTSYTVGELVGVMVALMKNTVVSKSLYISKISLPVHNFSIVMLLIKMTMMTLVFK